MSAVLETLNDRLGHWALCRPNDLAFTFLKRGEIPDGTMTFGSLHAEAEIIANNLIARGLNGHPVLLAFPSGLDFIAALFGCFLSGAIAVPVPYPMQTQAVQRLAHVAQTARARAVILPKDSEAITGMRAGFAHMPQLDLITLDMLHVGSPQKLHRIAPEQPAFLQFTSGSSGDPKGVIITHGNLAANMEMICIAFGDDVQSRGVSWLPVFHDMGLVGTVLQPIWLGAPVWLMSPYAFMQKPLRWLNAISTYGATTSGAPNFAYELISKNIEAKGLGDLDLSSWRVAFCGAEPVRAASLARFADLLAPAGFRRTALFPCYGMAEATLFVSGGPSGSGVKTDGPNGVTSCGKLAHPAGMRLVDPLTMQDVPTGKRGEILLSGPHVTGGYWHNDSANLAGFTKDEIGQSWLRTGDLGVVIDDELYVVGRLKDQVIVRGVNYSAEEIESALCQSDATLHASPAAVFNHGSDTVAMIEMRTRPGVIDDFASLADQANSAVTRAFGLRLDQILFLQWGGLPRTTSGKIRRHAAQEAYAVDASLGELLHVSVYKA